MSIEFLEGIILLVALVVASNILNHYFSFLPPSLIQIGFGLLIAVFFQVQIPLKTDWFLLLFIAPLLFNDGRRFPKQALWELKTPIFINAIVLVFVATFFGGLLIYWLIPGMPLSASFALAAILSPTDPVAVNSITEQLKMPKWITNLVAGESLINDASGLVGFKYGIAATVTGTFSLLNATGDFVYISIVGVLIGFLIGYLFRALRLLLRRKGFTNSTILVVLQLLTPFVVYLVAEELFHASGVIAVVAAGIYTARKEEGFLENDPEYAVVSTHVWEILVYLLDGIIFIILGIELPVAMQGAVTNPQINTAFAIALVFIIYLFLLILRTLWVYISNLIQKKQDKISFVEAVISGLTGVRGAVTMAGALSVPLLLDNGKEFPDRAMFLFISAGVILISLIAAVFLIPVLTKSKALLRFNTDPDSKISQNQPVLNFEQARRYIYGAAISAVEESRRQDENQQAALDVIDEYETMISQVVRGEAYQANDQAILIFKDEIALRKVGLRGEAEELERLFNNGELTTAQYDQLKQELAGQFTRLANLELSKNPNLRAKFSRLFAKIKTEVFHIFCRIFQIQPANNEVMINAQKAMAKNAIHYLSDYLKEEKKAHHEHNRRVIYHLIITYRKKIAELKSQDIKKNEKYDQQIIELHLAAFAAERAAVIDLVDHDKITHETATKLRAEINFAENALQTTTEETV